jgi:hypothetical protein
MIRDVGSPKAETDVGLAATGSLMPRVGFSALSSPG